MAQRVHLVIIAGIILANIGLIGWLYETIGWFDLRGYHEVLTGLVKFPILVLAAVNLLAAIVVACASRVPFKRSNMAHCLLICSMIIASAVIVAPPIGIFLNRHLLLPTPLMEAAFYGDGKVVMEKVRRGANPNIRHIALDTTPLHYMALCGEAEAVKTLLQKGAEPNAQAQPSNETPLHFALGRFPFHQNLATIQILVEFGADPKLPDWKGNTAFDLIEHISDPEQSVIRRILAKDSVLPPATNSDVR